VELGYESPQRAPEAISFEDDERFCALTFPLSPRWQALFGVVMSLILASTFLVGFAYGVQQFVLTGMPRFVIWVLAPFLGYGVLSAATAYFSLRSYLRFGQVPRSVSVDRIGKSLSIRAERAKWSHAWPLRSVRDVRLKPLKGVIGWGPTMELTLHIRGRLLPLQWRLREKDAPAVERFIECVQQACRDHSADDPAAQELHVPAHKLS
jgi:hypothetical protein